MKFRSAKDIKKRIDEIRKEQARIEAFIDKQEDNEVFDNSLYDRVDELEEEADQLELELERFF